MTGRPRIGVIVGPTASGKSSLAEALVERLDAEIVSADALQVYEGLDIGTAKPTPDALRRFRYHGVDIAKPDDRFTAARFAAICAFRSPWRSIGVREFNSTTSTKS